MHKPNSLTTFIALSIWWQSLDTHDAFEHSLIHKNEEHMWRTLELVLDKDNNGMEVSLTRHNNPKHCLKHNGKILKVDMIK